MIAIAHFVAIVCYIGAAALAAAPIARPVRAPVRLVIGALGCGVASHLIALLLATRETGPIPVSWTGQALLRSGQWVATVCYIGAAALAAAPIARPVRAPVLLVIGALGCGVAAHLIALFVAARELGQLPVSGLGPALSLAGLMVAATLLIAEIVTRD